MQAAQRMYIMARQLPMEPTVKIVDRDGEIDECHPDQENGLPGANQKERAALPAAF